MAEPICIRSRESAARGTKHLLVNESPERAREIRLAEEMGDGLPMKQLALDRPALDDPALLGRQPVQAGHEQSLDRARNRGRAEVARDRPGPFSRSRSP